MTLLPSPSLLPSGYLVPNGGYAVIGAARDWLPGLVLPHDVEGLMVDVLTRRHREHLATVERRRGVRPRTFEPYATVVRMSDAEGIRLGGDTVPACLLGVIGAPRVRRNENDALDVTLQVGIQVTVMGKKRRDMLLRRDVMAWTTVECLLQRLPRTGLISDAMLVDYEPIAEATTQRTVGDARIVMEVGVPDMLAIAGGLPADDTLLAPGAPGGPPTDPYEPPEPPSDVEIQPATITRTHLEVH